MTFRSALLTAACAAAALAAGCSQGPQPSHVAGGYRGKLQDDTMWEMATTVLLTTAPVVIATDCRPLAAALASSDAATIDRAVTAGEAARLPAGVTLYTPPFSPQNPKSAPFVVTDDKYAGTLCTAASVKVLKT